MSQTTIALPAVLKAVNGILTSLSAGKEIKVIFAGTPCTDGKTVYLGEPLLQSQDALDAYLSLTGRMRFITFYTVTLMK